jgi:hypothetical protein
MPIRPSYVDIQIEFVEKLRSVATPRPVTERVELSVNWSMIWRGDGGTLELKGDMTRRLAVCWNVLEGIPTDALAAEESARQQAAIQAALIRID